MHLIALELIQQRFSRNAVNSGGGIAASSHNHLVVQLDYLAADAFFESEQGDMKLDLLVVVDLRQMHPKLYCCPPIHLVSKRVTNCKLCLVWHGSLHILIYHSCLVYPPA